jgi:DNA-binding NtrC family response regulator
VVDDEPAVRRYVRRVLEAEGYDVAEAGDGDEASELLNAHPQRWDLVVSDIVMPRCTGVELHRRISGLAPGCAVILMSAYGSEQLSEWGITAPCGVLAKPFDAERLLQEVRRCLPVGS